MDYKNIHIGHLIEKVVLERTIELSHICKFFHCTEKEVEDMFTSGSLDTEVVLKWSKLLEYDLFRIYSQHLILYAPDSSKIGYNLPQKKEKVLPRFRKNIYTREVIDFILEQIRNGEMSRDEIVQRYKIPKTTLHKWIGKYDQ